MRNYPVRLGRRALRPVENDAVEVPEPAKGHRFMSFRYAYTEISVSGGKTRVKSKKTRFEDGKLAAEAFEGELDRSAYDQMVEQAQQYVLCQMDLFLQPLTSLLAFSRKPRSSRN